MESFINLMGNDEWSEADIKARLHAEIRSEVSEMAEAELNRALQGKMLGMHVMTPAEVALLMTFKAATDRVAILGAQARADMALLESVMALEAAQASLARPAAEDGSDTEARNAAQAVVDAASPQALALWLRRNPAQLDTEDDAALGGDVTDEFFRSRA